MNLKELVKKAREKQRLANTQEAKVARAQEKVRRAETMAQIEKARMDLQVAMLKKRQASIAAQIALEKAKTEVVKAQTARQKAADERLKAKFQRAKTAVAPATAAGKAIGKGLKKTADWLWSEPSTPRCKTSSSKGKTASSARKATPKRRVSRRQTVYYY